MPRLRTSPKFDRLYKKKATKNPRIKEAVDDALKKFTQDPIPNSLDLKPMKSQKGSDMWGIDMPKMGGWRIMLYRKQDEEGVYYEAFLFGNHNETKDLF